MPEIFWKRMCLLFAATGVLSALFFSSYKPASATVSWNPVTAVSSVSASSTAVVYNSVNSEFALAYTVAGGTSLRLTTTTSAGATWASTALLATPPTGQYFKSLEMILTDSAAPYYYGVAHYVDANSVIASGSEILYAAAGSSSSWTVTTSTGAFQIFSGGIGTQSGVPYIAGRATRSSIDYLYFGKGTGADTFFFTTSSVFTGNPNPIVMAASTNQIAVAYKSSSAQTFIIATTTSGTTFASSTITVASGTFTSPIARYDSTGKLWLAYANGAFGCASGCNLKLSRYEPASGWVTEEVDSVGTTSVSESGFGEYHSIGLAFIGTTPVVSYQNLSGGKIRYAIRDSGNTGCSGSNSASYTCGDIATGLSATQNSRISVATNGTTRIMVAYSDPANSTIVGAVTDYSAATVSSGSTTLHVAPQPLNITDFSVVGVTTTPTSTIALHLQADGASEMALSQDPSFGDAIWQPYQTNFNYKIKEISGEQMVYVKAGNTAGTISSPAQLSVTYAPEILTGSISARGVNGALISTTTLQLVLAFSNNAAEMTLSSTSTFSGAVWQPITTSTPWILTRGDGAKSVYFKVRSVNHIESPSYSISFTLDTVPPRVPHISLPADGAELVDAFLNAAGFGELGSQIRLRVLSETDVPLTALQAVTSAGAWSYLGTTPLDAGKYTLVATALDAAGNESAPTTTHFSILDLVPPEMPIVVEPINMSSLATTTFTISGSGEPKSTVVLVRDGVSTYLAKVLADHSWSIDALLSKKTGEYVFAYHARDTAGNMSSSSVFSIFLNLPEPTQPAPVPNPTEKPPQPPALALTPTAPEAAAPNAAGFGSNDNTGGVSSAPAGGSETTGDLSGTGGGGAGGGTSGSGGTSPIALVTQAVDLLGFGSKISAASVDFIETTQRVVTQTTQAVVKNVKKTAKAAQVIAAKPEVQVANQAVVVPVIAVAAGATVSGAINISQFFVYLKFLFTQPLFLLARRKRKGWGVVYNALTKMPADLAVVRVVSAASGKVVQSQVTDREGRYQFFVQPGGYKLDISKPDYVFPPLYLSGKTDDDTYSDLYTGGELHPEIAAPLSFNTPLDPTGAVSSAESVLHADRKKRIAAAFGSVGVIITLVSFAVSPTILVGCFVMFHLISHMAFRRIAHPHRPKTWGIVTDAATGKPVDKTIVRIFDTQYNKLLETQVTDDKGRYAFLVGKNSYIVTAEKQGVGSYRSQPIVIDAVSAISQNIVLSPAAPPVVATPVPASAPEPQLTTPVGASGPSKPQA